MTATPMRWLRAELNAESTSFLMSAKSSTPLFDRQTEIHQKEAVSYNNGVENLATKQHEQNTNQDTALSCRFPVISWLRFLLSHL